MCVEIQAISKCSCCLKVLSILLLFLQINPKPKNFRKNCSYYKSCDLFSSASCDDSVFCYDRYLAIYARSCHRNEFLGFLQCPLILAKIGVVLQIVMRFKNVGVYEILISGSRCFDGYKLKDRPTLLGVLLGCERSKVELILINRYKYSSGILYFLRVSDHCFYLTF